MIEFVSKPTPLVELLKEKSKRQKDPAAETEIQGSARL